MDIYKDASPTRIHQKFSFIPGITYPPVHKDIQTELYSTGVPLIAERIFSHLNPLLFQTGLMHLNETVVEHVSLVGICVKVLGMKVASGRL